MLEVSGIDYSAEMFWFRLRNGFHLVFWASRLRFFRRWVNKDVYHVEAGRTLVLSPTLSCHLGL